MNGMKKLLGVIGILALAAALLPAQGFADLRGSFALVSNGAPHPNGCEQPAIRPGGAGDIMVIANPLDAGQTLVEFFFAYSTRSLIPGREHVRSIFQLANVDQAVGRGFLDMELKHHPTGDISYFDPAWSYDGKYLAYVQQNADGTGTGLWIQEYTVSDDEVIAATPIGSAFQVYSGNVRRPAWHPSQYTLSFDSNDAGSFDIYTVDVDPVAQTVAAPVRRTFDNLRAEQMSSWHPNGHDILYSTNKFGPNIIEIIDIALSSGDPGYTRLAEANFKFVQHNNADFSSDGNDIFYDAPSGEDPNGLAAIWRLNVPSQSKCEIQLDILADSDPSVSGIVNHTREGIPFNHYLFVTQSGGGLNTWRGNAVNSCLTPLPMAITTDPAIINPGNQLYFSTFMRFPAETKAAGYVCRTGNVGGEGVRVRTSIFNSPVLLGNLAPTTIADPALPPPVAGTASQCYDTVDTLSTSPLVTDRVLKCIWRRRTVIDRMTALGLTDKQVAMQMTAYSNWTGRPFQGFAYIKVTQKANAGSVTLLNNSPNPFNPVTKIKFAVEKAGNYAVKVYNVHGALVKTLANQNYDAGVHEVGWDGRNTAGLKAASGVYYAKIHSSTGDESNSIRLVLAK
jgi:hypothetical protein